MNCAEKNIRANNLLQFIHQVTIEIRFRKSLVQERFKSKIVSEYDQEIPQSQTADNPVAPQGRAAQPSQDTRKTN